MSNIDEWLSTLGINDEDPSTQQTVDSSLEIMNNSSEVLQPVQQASQSLSEEDFDSVHEEFGFPHTENADAEEIPEDEEGNEEEVENTEESRDLDAEEDADWQEAIDSGGIVPVFTQAFEEGIVNGETVVRVDYDGSVHNSSMSEMADAAHFHMPDGVVSVPIITEEKNQELHELEQAAIEAHQAVVEASSQSEPLIPLNSPTLLLDESTTRFSGAEWYNEIQKKRIIVAGQGGIGSNLSFQLARMHPAGLYLYDDDMVETVNMAGQLYARNDIGKSKVAAIADMITAYTNMQNVFAIKDKFTETTEAGDIMMCGFDNMKARKLFFDSWHNHVQNKPVEERKYCLYLDGIKKCLSTNL